MKRLPLNQTGAVLYFPNFSPDDTWLKCALLYWDRIRRIVPDEVLQEVENADTHSAEVARKNELLIATDCRDFRNAGAARFATQITPLLKTDNPQAEAWVSNAAKPSTKVHGTKIGFMPRIPGIQSHWIHGEKIPHAIKNRLIDKGLFTPHGDYVEMPTFAADLYMTCLADEMSEKLGTPLFTDQATLSAGSEQLVYVDKSFTPSGRGRTAVLQKLGIRFPHPNQLRNVSMQKILKFREDHDSERVAFRDKMESVLKLVAKAGSKEHKEDILAQHRSEVRQLINNHRSRLRDLGIKGLWSFLTISVPSFVGLLPANIVDPSALGVSCVAVGAAACWAGIRKDRRELAQANPWHYALSLQKSFE